MPRRVRFVPDRGSLVEVTVRTIQSRFLLRPSPSLNQVVGGVLGRAQDQHQVRCHAAVFMSGHFHLLLSVDDANQLARFMEYVDSNLAREIKRLHDWPEHVWGRRYQAILVSEEEAAQVDRFRYILSHGVKEGLVAHARDWPGVHCVRELLAGEAIQGLWFNRTAEYTARNRGEHFDRLKYATEQTFELTPLPCWSHLSAEAYQERVASLVTEIESEAAAELAKIGREPLGMAAILRQHPHTRPNSTKKSPAPFYHAATKIVRKAFWHAYAAFVSVFREAADRWREGDRKARFPVGSFPPGLPFVTEEAYSPP
jgi:REP element-mobilizing transposase RayT